MLSKAPLTSHSRTSGSVLSDHTVMVIQVIKTFFFVYFLCVFLLPLLNLFSVVDVSGGESKVQCCKEQYCIGTWNVKSRNQGKLSMVKQEVARVNTGILGISELKWMEMEEFNSDDHISTTQGKNPLEEME